jgi:beta-phosphoglucomutase-like phosphatase (HAD superfamily)
LPVFLTRKEIDARGQDLEKHRGDVLKKRYLPQIKAFPKVTELFHRIRADKIKIVLASSAKAEELRTYKKIAGIDELIDVETSSDDAEKSKPHPDIFQAAMASLGRPKVGCRCYRRHALRCRGCGQGGSEHNWFPLWRLLRSRTSRCRLLRDL